MSEIALRFATEGWFEQVYRDPPAREVKGRTKWTHRHATWVEYLNRLAYVESRNELIGLLVLEYLQRQGVVKRFKEQPFTTPPDLWASTDEANIPQGVRKYTPDFTAESYDDDKYVIEVKSARYVSRQMERDFELWRDRFSDYNLKYLVWTDQTPLEKSLRHNLLELRRAAVQFIKPDEVDHLVELLNNEGPLPLWALYARDLDRDLICHAAWHGKVFFPIHQVFGAQTVVSLQRTKDLESLLFGAEPDIEAWWNSLEAA